MLEQPSSPGKGLQVLRRQGLAPHDAWAQLLPSAVGRRLRREPAWTLRLPSPPTTQASLAGQEAWAPQLQRAWGQEPLRELRLGRQQGQPSLVVQAQLPWRQHQ